MKTKLATLVSACAIAAGLLSAAPALLAQDGPPSGERPRRENAGNPEQRLNRLKEALQLTEEQVASLKEIFMAEAEAMRAAREKLGADATREQRRAARREIQEKMQPKIEAVLTEEQRAKWAEIRERWQQRGPGGPGGERPRPAAEETKSEA